MVHEPWIKKARVVRAMSALRLKEASDGQPECLSLPSIRELLRFRKNFNMLIVVATPGTRKEDTDPTNRIWLLSPRHNRPSDGARSTRNEIPPPHADP
jgi:hypothetical protein